MALQLGGNDADTKCALNLPIRQRMAHATLGWFALPVSVPVRFLAEIEPYPCKGIWCFLILAAAAVAAWCDVSTINNKAILAATKSLRN